VAKYLRTKVIEVLAEPNILDKASIKQRVDTIFYEGNIVFTKKYGTGGLSLIANEPEFN
jgi:hypothetical protein